MLNDLAAVLERVAAAEEARKAHVARVEAEGADVLLQLSRALLPALVPQNLDVAADAVGIPGLASAVVMPALAAERAQLGTALREVESSGGPAADAQRLDAIERELQDVAAWRESMKNAIDRRLADPEFRQLEDDERGGSWWMFSFYRRVARADAVVKRHGESQGIRDWPALLAHHARQLEALKTLDEQRAELVRERALRRSRMQRHAELNTALAGLEARHLQQAQGLLAQGISVLPHARALQVLPAWAHPLVTRLHGLRHKAHYLGQMGPLLVGRIHAEADELHRRLQRMQETGGDGVVYSRQDRAAGLQQRLDHAAQLMDRMVGWDAYARFHPSWPLWWDWFFDGAEPGTFLDEIAAFRAEHRGITFQKHVAALSAPASAQSPVRPDPHHRPGREQLTGPAGSLLGAPGDDAGGEGNAG